MGLTCVHCGNDLEMGMNFCPYCGGTQQAPTTYPWVQPQYQGPQNQLPPYMAGAPYPMAPMPYPMFYNPGPSGGRMAAAAGSILGLIDGILALLLAIILFFDLDFTVFALLLIAGFIMSMVTVIAVFRHWRPPYAVIGPLILVLAGLTFMFMGWWLFFIGLIGFILAIISLALVLAGWRDMSIRADLREEYGSHYGQGPVMPPMSPIPPFER